MTNLGLAVVVCVIIALFLMVIFVSTAEAKAHTRLADEIRSWRVSKNQPISIRFDNPLDLVTWDSIPVPEKPPTTPPDGTPVGGKGGKGISAVIRSMPMDV